MDGCQVDWTARQQVALGTQVYVVKDAAQTIYSFRGAKSKCLMKLPVDKDCLLTSSFRVSGLVPTLLGRLTACYSQKTILPKVRWVRMV